MRYCLTLYLKGYQKCNKNKLKVQLLLSKFRCFNSDLSYFWYLLRYRVTQYLIWKFLSVGQYELRKLRISSKFIICQGILKIASLLHKRGFFDSQLLCTVYYWLSKPSRISNFHLLDQDRNKKKTSFKGLNFQKWVLDRNDLPYSLYYKTLLNIGRNKRFRIRI